MRRRDFIKVIASSAAVWPFAAHAQPQALPVVGFLNSGSPGGRAHLLAAFHQGLSETGYVEGRNVAIEYRWAEDQYDRLPTLAADLARRPVTVIAATGDTAFAAKRATTTIPIVCLFPRDPIRDGFVASLNRPGGNITGVSLVASVIEAKQLEMVRELTPAATTIAVLVNPTNPNAEVVSKDLLAAARTIGMQLHVLHAANERDFDSAFAGMVRLRAGALIVGTDPMFLDRRDRLVALSARHGIPTIYGRREFAATGGLISFGTSLADAYRQVGIYSGRVLKGTKPADLPVMQPTKFELIINLKTAKALGLTVPNTLLVSATEVID